MSRILLKPGPLDDEFAEIELHDAPRAGAPRLPAPPHSFLERPATRVRDLAGGI
jgi:hypothetical protein